MLIAKLKNSLDLGVQISPIQLEKREVDSFCVNVVNYQMAKQGITQKNEEGSFMIYFTKSKMVKKNPSSDVDGEGELVEGFKLEKVFMLTLTSEEMNSWGNDDTTLFQIIASKYNLEIDDYIEVDALIN